MGMSITCQSKISAMSPIISVILPVFNAEKYIKEAVQSIIDQTFGDFELIIINDGSTDGSLEILEQFKALDKRVVLITRENQGLVKTLNEGVSIASGQWIARMDADDIALSNRFECQMQWLMQNNLDICGSWVSLFGTADKRILKHSQTDAAIKMEMLFGTPFAHPSVIMKKELVKKLLYDIAWEKCEDYDLWERAARAGWRMGNVPKVLLLYRQHSSQVSSKAFIHQQVLTQKIRRRYWLGVFDSLNIKNEWIDEVLKLREPVLQKTNMDYVDLAVIELLQCTHGEAQKIILDHATRLYFRAAATCPDVAVRWGRLNARFGVNYGVFTKIQLWFLSVLHINSRGKLFEYFKKIYFYVSRST